MPAFFQDLDIQLAQQRLGGGCAFEQDTVTGYNAGGMFDQYLGEFLNAEIGHEATPMILLAIVQNSYPRKNSIHACAPAGGL